MSGKNLLVVVPDGWTVKYSHSQYLPQDKPIIVDLDAIAIKRDFTFGEIPSFGLDVYEADLYDGTASL